MKASIVEMEGLLRGKCVPAKMLVNESLAEYLVRQFDALHERADKAERERDELRAEQAEHDEQIARMESKFSLAKRALDSKTARCEKAEAELRRRDSAAGEPVHFFTVSITPLTA
jgi:predicted  nucleic acid-binding Zn-ribbon protein